MPIVTENDLKKNIESGKMLPVYFIYGNDDGLKKLYASKIRSKIVPEDDCFNFQRFEGDCELQGVYDAVMQFPMMAERKCVVLADYDFEKCGEHNLGRLVSLIEETPDTSTLILWFDTAQVDDKKSSKAKKLFAAVEKAGGITVRLDHRTTADLVRMLCAGAERRGCKMEGSTARYLIETCSADYNILKNELEKLCSFAGAALITREMIDSVCVRSVEASIYNISRELTARNIGKSINMLDELLFLKVKPHVILSVLSSAFIEMYIAKTAADAGVRPADAAAHFGYKGREFVITRALDNSRKMSERQIGLCLSELLLADEKIKSFTCDEQTVLEELMVKLVYIMSEGEKIDKA
ncbi:MAG: DNA polymerase III subunit delta [Clostridia bacterium]|nr:DNA polymerase III subunit delta [Oscillospiraceae bacterium]MBR6694684.1 DNA polymerase III subunit delta [Clostridia bacterium]